MSFYQLTDYPTFGSPMPTRQWSDPNSKYKYGFNGQEKDDDISGNGNTYMAEYWEYDSRLGRRWNLDPIIIPGNSGFLSFNNSPISFNDDIGLSWVPRHVRRMLKRAKQLAVMGIPFIITEDPDSKGTFVIEIFWGWWQKSETTLINYETIYAVHKISITNKNTKESFERNVFDKISDILHRYDKWLKKYEGNAKFKYGFVYKGSEDRGDNRVSKAAPDAMVINFDKNDKDLFETLSEVDELPDFDPDMNLTPADFKEHFKDKVEEPINATLENTGVHFDNFKTSEKDTVFKDTSDLIKYNANNPKRRAKPAPTTK